MGHANFGLNDHRARRTQLYTLVTRGSIVILENSRKSDYDFFLELYLSLKVFILIISQHSHLEFDLELDLWLFFSRTLDDSKIQYFFVNSRKSLSEPWLTESKSIHRIFLKKDKKGKVHKGHVKEYWRKEMNGEIIFSRILKLKSTENR